MAVSYKYWTTRWENYAGQTCIVTITDIESTATAGYSLTPGGSPFISSKAGDENPLAPLREGSARLSVIDNYGVLKQWTLTSSHRYRVVLRVAGAVKWLGWLKAESLTQSYGSAKNEFTVNCIDDLQAIRGWDVTKKALDINGNETDEAEQIAFSGKFEPVSVGNIIAECFCRVNGRVNDDNLTFVFPAEGASGKVWPLEVFVSRYLFFERKQIDPEDEESVVHDPAALDDVLKIICTAFGWTCQQEGTQIIFSSPRVSGSNSVAISLAGLLADGVASAGSSAMTEVSAVSVAGGHNIDLFSGVHRVCVRAKVKTLDVMLPTLDSGQIELVQPEAAKRWWPTTDRALWCKGYTYKSLDDSVKLRDFNFSLQPTTDGNICGYTPVDHDDRGWYVADVVDPADGATAASNSGWLRTGVAKVDGYRLDSNKKNYDYKTGYVINQRLPYVYAGQSASGEDQYETVYPLAVMDYPYIELHGNVTNLGGGSALVLNMNLGDFSGKDHNFKAVYFSLKIGDKYFTPNLSTRQTTPVHADASSNNYGWWDQETIINCDIDGSRLKNVKKLSMPWNGADGYIMPVYESLSGEVVLKMWFIETNYPTNVMHGIVSDIKLEVVAQDDVLNDELPSSYSYIKYIAGWTDKLGEVAVNIHSRRDNRQSDGQMLMEADSTLVPGTKYFVPLTYYTDAAGDEVRPEAALLAKYVSMYGRARQMLTLTLKTGALSCKDVYVDASSKKWAVLACTQTNWRTGASTYILVDL